MEISMCGNLIVGALSPRVQVVRFAHPDLQDQLPDDTDFERCELFQELYDMVLAGVGKGETVVLNLGLVESFPAAFMGFLIKVGQIVRAYGGHLILCRVRSEYQTVLKQNRLLRSLNITSTEAEAVREAAA